MMRADRVYRTGVIPPLVSVNPGQNVQDVAQAFTDRGASLQLNGPTPLSWWQRKKLEWAYRKASKRTFKMLQNLATEAPAPGAPTMSGLHGPAFGRLRMENLAVAIANGNPPMPTGARTYLQAGSAIVPQGTSLPMQLAAEAVAGSPPEIRRKAAALGARNWLNPRRGSFDRGTR